MPCEQPRQREVQGMEDYLLSGLLLVHFFIELHLCVRRSAKNVCSLLSPQTHTMRKHAVLVLTTMVGRTSMLRVVCTVLPGLEGKSVIAHLGCAGEGGGAQLFALPNTSLTKAPE